MQHFEPTPVHNPINEFNCFSDEQDSVQNLNCSLNAHDICSLPTASLSVGKALVDKKCINLYARGTCMFPCVRPGDLLQIESREVKEIKVGDIAVCHKNGLLFGHRVIKKIIDNNKPAVITRSDRSTQSSDGPTFDSDVLGIVTMIVRGAKHHGPERRRYTLPERLCLETRLAIIENYFAMRQQLAPLLTRIQCTNIYGQFTRFYLAVGSAKISYVVQLPLRAGQQHDLFHPVNADEFDITEPTWQGRLPDCWTLALYLKDNRHPVGKATFIFQSAEDRQPDWQVSEMWVRVRYQGFGFEKNISSKAGEIFARSGVKFRGAANKTPN